MRRVRHAQIRRMDSVLIWKRVIFLATTRCYCCCCTNSFLKPERPDLAGILPPSGHSVWNISFWNTIGGVPTEFFAVKTASITSRVMCTACVGRQSDLTAQNIFTQFYHQFWQALPEFEFAIISTTQLMIMADSLISLTLSLAQGNMLPLFRSKLWLMVLNGPFLKTIRPIWLWWWRQLSLWK